jgi:uncharacterized protein DUF3105/FHA domain-containing protein
MATYRLRVTGGGAAGTVIEVGDELIVGRTQEGPGGMAGDREISRRHARVYVEPGGGLAIEDLDSTNGTFIDGERITGSRPLPDGATVRMGLTTLVVETVPEAAPGPPPPADATQIDRPVPPSPPPPEPPPPAEPPPVYAPPQGPPAAAPPMPGPPAPPPPAAPPRAGTPRVLVAVLVGVFVLAGLGIAAVLLFTGDDTKKDEKRQELGVVGPPQVVSTARAAGCTARTEPSEGNEHVDTTPTYKSNPPHSGPHNPTPAGDGQYRNAPPLPKLVHALEHGRIVMWFKPGDNATRDALLKIGNEDARHMILAPNATMPYEAAASAWTHVLGCPKMNDDVPAAVRAFRDAYRDKGPEFVP